MQTDRCSFNSCGYRSISSESVLRCLASNTRFNRREDLFERNNLYGESDLLVSGSGA